jgi:hypothetical protein
MFIAAAIIAIIVVTIGFLNRRDEDYGMVEVTDYVQDAACDAMMPGCGYCPGTVTAGRCFIIRGKDYPYFDFSVYY